MFNSSAGIDRKFVIGAIIAVFIFIVIGFDLWDRRKSEPVSSSDVSANGASPLPPIAAGTPAEPPAMARVTPYQGRLVHIMEADPEVLKQIPAETYQKSRDELADLAVKLADDPRRPEDWMRVAFIKRFYHDYPGARDAYEYLNRIAESDPIPFYNLGSLYGYYLKEPQKAIPKYQAAIERDQLNSSFYIGFADFYREVITDLPSAEKILFQGLAKVPSDVNFMIALGGLYKVMGNIPKAVEYYEKALAFPAIGSGQRAAISAEVERLRQTLEAK